MSSKQPVVLIAEDDASVRLAMEVALQYEGFNVVTAEDGEKALDIARREKPDVILLDHLMPRMDGKEVLEALRKSDATSGIPVLVLTGMDRGEPDEWAGAEFLGKPFSPDELVDRIRGALDPGSPGPSGGG
jgi:DNA-binding response OmpR family regulator